MLVRIKVEYIFIFIQRQAGYAGASWRLCYFAGFIIAIFYPVAFHGSHVKEQNIYGTGQSLFDKTNEASSSRLFW